MAKNPDNEARPPGYVRVESRPDGILVGFDYENCVLSVEQAKRVIRELGRIVAAHEARRGPNP